MNSAPEQSPPTSSADSLQRWWTNSTSWFLFGVCLSLALLITKTQLQTDEGEVALVRRLKVHNLVLEHKSWMPYQEHAFLASHLAQWMHDALGIELRLAFHAISGGGYLCVLLATWCWLAHLGNSPSAILAGLFYVAAFAGILIPYGLDHPSDTYGTAVLLVALVAAGRRQWLGMSIISLLAGFLWRKHVLVAPILVVYAAIRRQWRELPWAVVAGVASFVGPVIYVRTLGVHEPGGVSTLEEFVGKIPLSIVYQLLFAGPPLAALWMIRRQVKPLLLASVIVYPAVLAVYTVQLFWLYELRSFWVAVPVFAALMSAWCDAAWRDDSRSRG